MRHFAIGSWCVAFVSAASFGYVPPAGYIKIPEKFSGDTFAVARDGKVAVGVGNFGGGASITIYPSAAAAQTLSGAIRTFTDVSFKAFGDITFVDNDTLVFSENADKDTVYRGVISSGIASALAPTGSVPAAGGLAVSGSTVYATSVGDPGSGALFSVPLAGGSATSHLSGIGTGYLDGIAIDGSGNFLLTDTNDPNFEGKAGKVLRFDSDFFAIASIDLTGGAGAGAYDIILDSEGDAFITTGETITTIPFGTTSAQQFGSRFSLFSFPTGLDFVGAGFEPTSGSGTLFVNAVFTEEGKIIGIVPEPACAAFAALGLLLLRRRVRVVAPAVLLAMTSAAPAENFFATQVISTSIGSSQQAGFTDPQVMLGGPRGGGTGQNGIDVFNAGNGGAVTLGFDSPGVQRKIFDHHDGNIAKPDFIVFENAFYKSGNASQSFAELMFVEVSSDGTNFARFPTDSFSIGPIGPTGTVDPANVHGFAGVLPVLANVDENAISPFDPLVAGGDAFDLAELSSDPLVVAGTVNLDAIRYVRIVDVIGNGTLTDSDGRQIWDPSGFGIGGGDVDAVAVISGIVPEPTSTMALSIIAISFSLSRNARRGQG